MTHRTARRALAAALFAWGPLLLATGVTIKNGHHATWWLHPKPGPEEAKAGQAARSATDTEAPTQPEDTFMDSDPGIPVKFGAT